MRGDVREEAGTDVLSLGIFSRSDQPLVSSGQLPRPLRTTAQQHVICSQFICITHLMFPEEKPYTGQNKIQKSKCCQKESNFKWLLFSFRGHNMWNLWDDKNVNLKCQHWKMHISMSLFCRYNEIISACEDGLKCRLLIHQVFKMQINCRPCEKLFPNIYWITCES